jgi:hypothetical protein
MKIRLGKTSSVLGVGILLGAAAAVVPVSAVAEPALQLAQAETQYSEQELRSYASAVAGIRQIEMAANQQLNAAAGDPQASQQIQQQAQQEMVAAVQDAGLTVEEYNAITQATTANTDLATTLEGYIAEEMGAPQ